jgi:multiple sugar transport system substrate-binding protein
MKYLGMILLCFSLWAEAQETTLEVGILLANHGQGKGYRELFNRFEAQQPEIQVRLRAYTDQEYKQKLLHWVETRQGPDVFYWQAGERLFELARGNSIRSLNPLWQDAGWETRFSPAIQALMTENGQVYALPFAFYQWGFYYSKPVFERLGLEAPATWNEFTQVAESLKQHGLDAITIGTKFDWPAAAWFDYLNLRINGLAFYQSLLAGKVSYTDPKVRRVLDTWKTLIDAGYFVAAHSTLTWLQAMPELYRKQAGMTLIGNFVESKIPQQKQTEIGFFPFPEIDSSIPRYELMPMEVFVLADWSTKAEQAYTLLKFLAEPETQRTLATGLGYIPATSEGRGEVSRLSQEGVKLLKASQGLMQYFDRDTKQAFSRKAVPVLSRFLREPDVDATLQALEALRLAHQ